jgi:hypothetical protein
MDMQMQLKRGVIALMVWAVLGGFVLSRAGTLADAGDRAPALLPAALDSGRECDKRLRIELTPSMRLTVPCDHSCGPIRNVARVLHMPVAAVAGSCSDSRHA